MRKVIASILLILNILVAFALLLASVAGYINPLKCWPIAFLGFSFPFLFITNLVFFFIWLSFWKKEIGISIIAILISVWHLPNFVSYNEKRDKPDDKQALRVISYNVNLFNQYNKDSSKAKQHIAFITKQDADIICMQEFFTMKNQLSEKQVKVLFKDYPYYYINYTIEKNSREAKFGNAIFSKYPIIKSKAIQFAESSYNSAIYSDIKVKKDTIRVFCGHLESTKLQGHDKPDRLRERLLKNDINVTGVKSIAKKLKSAYLIRAKQADSIRKVEEHTRFPIIFCGDFNDLPSSYTYNTIKGGKLDAYCEAGNGFTSTFKGMLPTMRIDFIFSDTSIIPYRYRSPRVKYSDHYPIIVDLYFKK